MTSGFEFRTNLIKIIFSLLGVVILSRMIYFQSSASSRAQQQQWDRMYNGSEVEIQPTRGLIYDRGGNPLATNITVYEVGVDLQQVQINQNAETISSVLSRILNVPYDDIYSQVTIPFHETTARYRKVADFVAQEKIDQLELTYSEYENLKGSRKNPAPTLKGLEWNPQLIRQYPEGPLASNIIGYVTEYGISTRGVEKQYEDLLSGVPSKFFQSGIPNMINDDSTLPQGASLILTIDREIQMTVEDILDQAVQQTGSKSGVIIVADPETGEILAMATSPRLNLKNYWDVNVDYMNRAIEVVYEPGSVFKVLTMAAALDSGVVTPETTFLDTGYIQVGGVSIYNWDGGAWGQQTMTGCMQHSLNVCFSWVAQQMGVSTFYNYLEAFNVGNRSGIDLDNEALYPLPIPGEGDLAANSFGQAVAMAPIQMVMAASALANDGQMMAPHVLSGIVDKGHQYNLPPRLVNRPISAETAHTITEMLTISLEEEASTALVPGYRVAGKTGTAEIPRDADDPLRSFDAYRDDATNASFIGWGPSDDPKFLVYVWLEEPESSQWGSVVAAPVFSEVVSELVVLMDIPPDEIRLQLANQ